MSTLVQEYRELIELSRLYLEQEYPKDTWLYTNPDHFHYFSTIAKTTPKKMHSPQVQNVKQIEPILSSTKPQTLTTQEDQKPKQIPSQIIQKPEEIKAQVQEIQIEPSSSEPIPIPVEKEKKVFIELDPPKKYQEVNFSSIEQFFVSTYPQIPIIKEIPEDNAARPVEQKSILVLSLNNSLTELSFLNNVCNALTVKFGSAGLLSAYEIEEKNEWQKIFSSQNLRLILCSDYEIYTLPQLMKLYKEDNNKRYLAEKPLFLLSPISQYLKEPQLKAALWRALCDQLEQ